jgi:predicted metal-dependent hydrolase
MHQIQVANIDIDVVRKDIKNLHLAVYPPSGRVRIATPLKIDDEAVRLFAISKLAWIKKKQRQFSDQSRQSVRECVSRESHYFEGKRYLLKVIEHNGPPKVELRNKAYLDLYVRRCSSQWQRQKVITEWYRQRLKEQIPGLVEKWQEIVGLEVKEWGVKQMKTKWGSCNASAKRIWLNLELAKKPRHCVEYIIVHEMVHFLERHHNDRFVAYMDKFIPNWRFYKEELNRYPLSHMNRRY